LAVILAAEANIVRSLYVIAIWAISQAIVVKED
jgi:hypothetical protein